MPRRRPALPSGALRGATLLTVVAAVVVAFELVTAVAHTSVYAQTGYQNLTATGNLVRDADLDPLAYFIPTQALVAAQRLIPRNATYTVVVGHEGPSTAGLPITDLFRLWLLPRRYTSDIRRADWAVAYYESSEALGVGYSKELGLAPGVNADKLVHSRT